MTSLQKRVVRAKIEDPDASNVEIAKITGVASGTGVGKILKKPHVAGFLSTFLDDHGASLEDSAKVIGDAHVAQKVKIMQHEGVIIESTPRTDHDVRLRAAELNLKARGKLRDGAEVTLNIFDGLSDEAIANIASGKKSINDFIDVSPQAGVDA